MDLATLRAALTCIGQTALTGEIAGAGMFLLALANGVHCPHCDRLTLGDDFSWWQAYFDVIDLLQVSGLAFGLVAVVGATRRWWGAVALLVGVVALALRPL